MIETGLTLGNLSELITEITLQELERLKWERWLKHGYDRKGRVVSYEKFWGEPYGGRH